MTTSGAETHPLDAETRARFRPVSEQRMARVTAGRETHDLVRVLRELDPEDSFLFTAPTLQVARTLREAICVYYAVFEMLERRLGLDDERRETASRDELTSKLTFVAAYSAFCASLFAEGQLGRLLPAETAKDLARCRAPEGFFTFGRGRDEDLKRLLTQYHGALMEAAGQEVSVFTQSLDLANYTATFFAAVAEQSRTIGQQQPRELRDLVEGVALRIDDIVIADWQRASSAGAVVRDFRTTTADEIVGNEVARQRILRYAERLSLYDPVVGRNPLLDLGGLPWSVFLDGAPGTGKTSLFRLFLTRLSECAAAAGLPLRYEFIDPGIKDEYYGRTARLLAEKLALAQRADGVAAIFFDDLDLLLTGDRSGPNVVGADRDILNLTMQHLDGFRTDPIGNCQTYAATNAPLGADDALRQRFQDRLLVDGPITSAQFTRLQQIKLLDPARQGLVEVEPGARAADEESAGRQPPTAREIFRQYGVRLQGEPNWDELGALCAEFKRRDERFSGRAIANAAQTLMVRAADFDLPPEWFEQRELFFDQPYERRVQILRELFTPITGEMVAQELHHHFETERRYARQQAEDERTRLLNELVRRYEAEQMLKQALRERERG